MQKKDREKSHVENEQEAQAGMAVFLEPSEPHGLQSALPEMHPRLQAELPSHRDGLPALSIQAGKKELLMNNENIPNKSAVDSVVPVPARRDKRPTFVKKIGKTTYSVTIHFSATSQKTMSEKIKRMLRDEMNRM